MKEISRVMVCVDLSDYSKMIIEETLAIVQGLKSEIIILNVVNSKDIDAVKNVSAHLPEKINIESYIKRVKTERHQKIKKMIEKHFHVDEACMKIIFRVGIPHQAILEAIETEKVDLVVIASKGRSNLIGTLHGSNSEKIFRHSPVPVHSVRSRELFGRNRKS